MDPAKPIRPSLWHLLWGVPFLLAGIGLFAYALIHGITHATDSLTQIVVPGSAELTLKPGSYTVFLEEQSVVDGKVYSTKQSVDGLTCRARSTPGGATIPISQSTTNTTYTVNGRSGHSVLQFPIQTGGKYNFACDYGKDGTGPQVVIAVGSGVGEAIMRTVIDGLASFFGGAAAALVIVFIVVLTRERNKKRLRQSALFPNTGQP
ncbi:MAG TPA: hypothetical protein VFU55_07795 [Terracidiphilus sp.]|nr:hypothetical protein [Terracidiphilus sp.]